MNTQLEAHNEKGVPLQRSKAERAHRCHNNATTQQLHEQSSVNSLLSLMRRFPSTSKREKRECTHLATRQ
jgi:hypothetical protein